MDYYGAHKYLKSENVLTCVKNLFSKKKILWTRLSELGITKFQGRFFIASALKKFHPFENKRDFYQHIEKNTQKIKLFYAKNNRSAVR